MTLDLTGRVALVTAASVPAAYQTAAALGRAGARVYVTDSRFDTALAVAGTLCAEGITASGLALDVADEDSWLSLATTLTDEQGRLDSLIYCDQPVALANLDETEPVLWDRTLAHNLTGFYYACRTLAPQLVACGGGQIIAVSAFPAGQADPDQLAAGAAAAGLRAMVQALARSYASERVRINAVTYRSADLGGSASLATRATGNQAVGQAVVWLCSELAAGVSCVIMPVEPGGPRG